MDFEAGDMLDRLEQIGSDIYGSRVISPLEPDPDMTGSYNHHLAGGWLEERCPSCNSELTCVIRWPREDKKFFEHYWYCKTCWLVYEHVWIGSAKVTNSPSQQSNEIVDN